MKNKGRALAEQGFFLCHVQTAAKKVSFLQLSRQATAACPDGSRQLVLSPWRSSSEFVTHISTQKP